MHAKFRISSDSRLLLEPSLSGPWSSPLHLFPLAHSISDCENRLCLWGWGQGQSQQRTIKQRWQVVAKDFGAYTPSLPKLLPGAILPSFVESEKTSSFPCICRSPKKERSRGNGTEPQNFNYGFELQMWRSQSLTNLQNREITIILYQCQER